jgi:hypothetical protein
MRPVSVRSISPTDISRTSPFHWVVPTRLQQIDVLTVFEKHKKKQNHLFAWLMNVWRRHISRVAKTFRQTTTNNKDKSETQVPEGRTEVYAK